MRVGALVLCLNEWRWMPAVLGQLLQVANRVLIIRCTRSFSGAPVEVLPAPALPLGVEVAMGTWPSEADARNAGLSLLSDCDYSFVVDSDEVVEVPTLRRLLAAGGRCACLPLHTYWKTPGYRIRYPSSEAVPVAPMLLARGVRFKHLRLVDLPASDFALVREYGHHLSYAHTDEEIREKLRLFGHAAEVVPGWYERVWLGWDRDHAMANLHPTEPWRYQRAVTVLDVGLGEVLRKSGCSF